MELIVDLKERSYPIIIKKNLLDSIHHKIKEIYKGNKIFILTDDNVNGYYGDKIVENLRAVGYEVKLLSLKPGEKSKSFDTLSVIYDSLLDFKMTRSDIMITLGGGVIGDIGGFAASTYLRGIDFIQVPTSLLAQVDSSVGGKVAVDLKRGKNLVGSFYHPKAVFIDPLVLNTLEEKFFSDGMGEVIKYGCIKDSEFFEFLSKIKSREELFENIEKVIYTCCDIKRAVVEKDEKDKGERMLLNFGHTLGHALEQYYNYSNYTHGEAVAIGMYQITLLSEEKGFTKKGTAEKIRKVLEQYNLPYNMEVKINDIVEGISLDKKNLGKALNLILLREIGHSEILKSNNSYFVK